MFSTRCASVEIELGRAGRPTLQRAESRTGISRSTIFAAGGQVHLFRQRVTIPNVDSPRLPMNCQLRFTIHDSRFWKKSSASAVPSIVP